MIVSEYGTELTSNAELAWCGEIGVEWHIAPGKPMQRIYVDETAKFGINPHAIEWMRWVSRLDPNAIQWVPI